jgi:RNA polymerase sigma-70 factor (ECF subfamily)
MDILVDRYKADLFSLCVKMTRCRLDADDLFQDTWIRVMKRLDSYSSEHRFKAWLFAICINRYRDLYRWHKRWRRRGRRRDVGEGTEDQLASIEAPDPDPEQEAISEENKVIVRRAIDQLDDSLRLPILLHYFQDLSTEEIGEVLKIPQGTVKSRLHKGRKRLRASMENAGYG